MVPQAYAYLNSYLTTDKQLKADHYEEHPDAGVNCEHEEETNL